MAEEPDLPWGDFGVLHVVGAECFIANSQGGGKQHKDSTSLFY